LAIEGKGVLKVSGLDGQDIKLSGLKEKGS
jgi:hypothetical protein